MNDLTPEELKQVLEALPPKTRKKVLEAATNALSPKRQPTRKTIHGDVLLPSLIVVHSQCLHCNSITTTKIKPRVRALMVKAGIHSRDRDRFKPKEEEYVVTRLAETRMCSYCVDYVRGLDRQELEESYMAILSMLNNVET